MVAYMLPKRRFVVFIGPGNYCTNQIVDEFYFLLVTPVPISKSQFPSQLIPGIIILSC